ncbi:MAG TPA: NTP transferase domain-containing protein [Caldilineae bacterium]|nr:NTP transferase domain-containing protein [Caldilineae bacterium]
MKREHTSRSHVPAVILAAGQGSRLREESRGIPKPMVKVLGLTLLERALLACREAGITEYYVVVGFEKEKVISHIRTLERRHGLSVHIVENPDWEEGNGVSALATAAHLDDQRPFLLTMCDHIVDPEIFELVLQSDGDSGVCLLAVDRRVDWVFDLEDATKVRLDGERIIAIGKDLPTFNGIDTGVFLCRPCLFEGLERARSQGEGSLSAGIRQLIPEGKIHAIDIGDRFWIDVDTPESLVHAKRLLLQRLAKPRGDGFISRHLNRPISRRISALLAHTPLTPNAISILSFAIGLLGALLFTIGTYPTMVLAGLLVQFASITDGCDGEIARLKFQASRFGAWFDTLLDRYADMFIVGGITYGYWKTHPDALTWLIGLLAVTGFILYSYTKKEFQVRYGYELNEHRLYRIIPGSRDVRLFLVFIGALVGYPFAAIVLTGLLSHLAVWLGFADVYLGASARQTSHSGR